MNSLRFAWICAFFAHGCFNPESGANEADTDTDAASNGTMDDSMSTGSAVTSVTNSSMTTEPTSTSPTQPTDPSDTMTTGPETDSESETQTSTTGVEPMCGDGVPVATELCFDNTPVTYAVDAGAVDLGIGDISANGMLGIVVYHANGGEGSLTLLEADGVGGFVPGDTQTAPAYGGRVRVADIDGDSDADIFAVGGDGFRHYRNEAAFFLDYDAPNFFAGTGNVAEVLVADLNGDDILDVLVSQAYAHTAYRGVMNAGDWAFDTDFFGFPTAGEGASGMIAGAFSFDGDEDIDVVGLNQYYSAVEVLTNDGGGAFAEHSNPSLCAGEFDGVRFGDWGDLDGDGNTDLVATCMDGDVGVALDDGTGMFANLSTLALAGAYRPTITDLDNDGAPDILVSSTTLMRAVIFLNDGAGAFELSDTQFMGTGPVQGAVAEDLDDDGALDVVVLSGGASSQVDVYFAMP